MKKRFNSRKVRAFTLSLLFIVSGVGASLLINPVGATPNALAPSGTAAVSAASAPLSQAEANWGYPNGNAFGQDYNPQNQINSSDAQYLGISWLYPLPSTPLSLSSLSTYFGTTSVNTAVLIINGTAIAMTQFDEVFAFNVANGNILWTFDSPLAINQTAGDGTGPINVHIHDGVYTVTTATFGSGVSGPTFWFQGGNNRVYAISLLTGHEEMNFSDFTGLSMVPGNNPADIYLGHPSNIIVDPKAGVLVNGLGSDFNDNTGRGFFAGWNLNTNPPTLKWLATDTPPQPGSDVALNPNFDTQLIANMTGAETFFPGQGAGSNGYTTPAEIAGGVLHNVNNDLVVNWKDLSSTQLNSTLYNDWGYSYQSAQCEAITGGRSTGSTANGWGGQWLLGSGPSAGLGFVNTNNKDPFASPCTPGPDLWSASSLALNMSTGQIVWGFQANAHDLWDYDCSWSNALANETVNGVNTEVIIKTCKNGYLYELNAVTGNLIWAWSPPSGVVTPGPVRCPVCYMWNPLNRTQMSFDFPTAMTNCAPAYTEACITGPQPPTLLWPAALGGFEDEQAYDPATNQIYATSHLIPSYTGYVPFNSSTYFTPQTGTSFLPCPNCGTINNNFTTWDIDAATGQTMWHYAVPDQGYRGQTDVSGNLVFLTDSSGDILMLNAQNGSVVRNYYVGAPMDVGVSIGASISGQEYIIFPVGTCSFNAIATCPGSTPGDLIALTLTNQPPPSSATTTTVTSVSTTTSVSASTVTVAGPGGQVITTTTTISGTPTTITTTAAAVTSTTTLTSASSTGVSATALYGVAAVAVIFIIISGYLAMRGRKPAS